jgi:hypothetical protein
VVYTTRIKYVGGEKIIREVSSGLRTNAPHLLSWTAPPLIIGFFFPCTISQPRNHSHLTFFSIKKKNKLFPIVLSQLEMAHFPIDFGQIIEILFHADTYEDFGLQLISLQNFLDKIGYAEIAS